MRHEAKAMKFATNQLQPQKRERIVHLCRLFSDVRAEAPRNSFSIPFANVVFMLAREMDGKRGIADYSFENEKRTAAISFPSLGVSLFFDMESPGKYTHTKELGGGRRFSTEREMGELEGELPGLAAEALQKKDSEIGGAAKKLAEGIASLSLEERRRLFCQTEKEWAGTGSGEIGKKKDGLKLLVFAVEASLNGGIEYRINRNDAETYNAEMALSHPGKQALAINLWVVGLNGDSAIFPEVEVSMGNGERRQCSLSELPRAVDMLA